MSNWDQMLQWEIVLPPSRPTEEELKRIVNVINDFDKNLPVAILGSTPEFRDILFSLGFSSIFIFEKSKDFYYQMTNLIQKEVSIKECVIYGDWLEKLPQFPQKFQFILSDLTMGNLNYQKLHSFYNSIYEALIPGGVFIDKVLVFDFEPLLLDNLFDKYESKPINLRTINDFSSEVLFCSELVAKYQKVDSSMFYRIIENGPYSQKIKLFTQKAKMITPEGFIWYYGKPWHELSHNYFGTYRIAHIYPESNPSSPYYNKTKHMFLYK